MSDWKAGDPCPYCGSTEVGEGSGTHMCNPSPFYQWRKFIGSPYREPKKRSARAKWALR